MPDAAIASGVAATSSIEHRKIVGVAFAADEAAAIDRIAQSMDPGQRHADCSISGAVTNRRPNCLAGVPSSHYTASSAAHQSSLSCLATGDTARSYSGVGKHRSTMTALKAAAVAAGSLTSAHTAIQTVVAEADHTTSAADLHSCRRTAAAAAVASAHLDGRRTATSLSQGSELLPQIPQ